MLTLAVVLSLQATTAVPHIPLAPPAPPIVTLSPPRAYIAERDTAARYTIDVEVRAGSELLWSGPMTVSTGRGSTFTRDQSEPSALPCNEDGYDQQTRNTLAIQLNTQRLYNAGDTFGITVKWGRSLPGICSFRNSNRTVELSESTRLEPGRAVTINGDGGLTVRLRRR